MRLVFGSYTIEEAYKYEIFALPCLIRVGEYSSAYGTVRENSFRNTSLTMLYGSRIILAEKFVPSEKFVPFVPSGKFAPLRI